MGQDKIERVDPIVLSPRDFVDEWIRHSWPEMSRWTEQSARSGLENLHRKWEGSFVSGESIPTLHCEQKPDLWQVGIGTSSSSKGQAAPYHFTMVAASDHPLVPSRRP